MLAVLTTAHPAAAGHTSPGGPSPAAGVSREVLRRQEVLDRLADEITPVPETQRASIPGYTGLVIDPKRGRLTVYWQGPVPEHVVRLVEHAPAGITASVRPAPYSLAQLRAARDRLVAAASEGEDGAVWTAAAPAPEGTGLQITYPPTVGPAAVRAPGAAEQHRVAERAAELARVPVEAVAGETPQATATRHNDSSPWSAGAELTTPDGGFCSSGFGGWRGKTAILLTAAHCGKTGTYKTGAGAEIGSAADSDNNLDTTVINLKGTPSGQFYDGHWDNSTGYRKRTFGAGHNNVGGLVCDSGAMSGVHCGLKITATEISANVEGSWHSDLDSAVRTDDSTVTVAQGDSGGPMVASINGGEDMQARGIISAGGGQRVVCGGVAATTTCFDTVLFVPISPIVDKFGISIA